MGKYLLDTCVLSELIKKSPDTNVVAWFQERKAHELYASIMTWAELQRGIYRLPESKRRTELTLWLTQLEISFENRILPFEKNTARAWAKITTDAESQGKTIAAFDSIIAATARANDCTLVTRNIRDFAHAGIHIIDPWQAQS